MSTTEETQKVHDLISKSRFAMLTTVDHAEGRLVSRPMGVQEVEDDGTVWFFASDESPKADQLEADPIVNLSFTSSTSWVSLAGRAEIVKDKAKIKDLWNKGVEAWFPDGPDGDDVALLKIVPDSAEYWDTPGTRLTATIAYAKSAITGKRPDVGESNVVEL